MIPNNIPHISCDQIDRDDREGHKYTELFATFELSTRIPQTSCVIGLDGFDGVGKTTLARYLANARDVPLISLDDFVIKNQGCFFDSIRFDELFYKFVETLNRCGGAFVEGCLLDAVLERIGQDTEFRIYVMRTSRMWSRSDVERIQEYETLYGEKSATALISELEEQTRRFSRLMPKEFGGGRSEQLPGLAKELICYHRQRRPHDRADLIVKVVRTN